ncbi:hypothetical protein Taro_021162 [Colocasia esculenta]|uniref:Uncharacterized protein n=1 Tax=Colocasia esculenta TaxID=4460 RepID=A0A843UY77_COLES|nr:hypothetical protein [Colocasia esculenta]
MQVASGKRTVATRPHRDGQLRRNKVASDPGDSSSDVATGSGTSTGRQTAGMLHPGVATTTLSTPQRGGEHGQSSKHKHSTKWTPNPHQQARAQESLQRTKNQPTKGPSRCHDHLLLAPRCSAAPPRARRRLHHAQANGEGEGKLLLLEEEKEMRRAKIGGRGAGQGFLPPAPRTRRDWAS